MSKHNNNSFTPEKLGRNTIFPTYNPQDIREMNIILARLKALGIEMGDSFASSTDETDKQYNEDVYTAKMYIFDGKSVPVDVEQRLLDRLYSKNGINHKLSSIDITLNDKDFEEFLQTMGANQV